MKKIEDERIKISMVMSKNVRSLDEKNEMKTGEKTESGSKSKSEKGLFKIPFDKTKSKKTVLSDKIREANKVFEIEQE
jgi:hypothetical protein